MDQIWGYDVPDVDPLPLNSTVIHGSLSNSLQYFVKYNNKPSHWVYLKLVVGVGRAHEAENQRGFTQLLSRLSLRHTSHFQDGEILNYLEAIGSSPGGVDNARVYLENTIYSLEVPVGKSPLNDDVHKGLRILGDIAQNVAFEKTILDEEKARFLQNNRFYNMEEFIVSDTHPTLDSMTLMDINLFYKMWYRFDNMALFVVGDFGDLSQVLESIGKFFDNGDMTHESPKTLIKPRPLLKPPAVKIKNDGRTASAEASIKIYFRLESDHYQRRLEDQMFHYSLEAIVRLIKSRFLKRSEFSHLGVSTNLLKISKGTIVLELICSADVGKEQETLDIILTEMERLKKVPITYSDMDKIKLFFSEFYLRKVQGQTKESSQSILKSLLNDYLFNEGFFDESTFRSMILRIIQKWTPADIQIGRAHV